MKRISVLVFLFTAYSFVLMTLSSCVQATGEESLPSVSSGNIIRVDAFNSKNIGQRTIDFWLPEDYDNGEDNALLFMHDGQMLFDSSVTWNGQEWGVDELLTKHADEYQKTIVVGIHNAGEARLTEYYPQKAANFLSEKDKLKFEKDLEHPLSADAYLKFIVEELKPYVEDNYPVYTDAEHTFIAGSSMGGLISWYALCEYPDVFGGAACLSTHWPIHYTNDDNPMPAAFLAYLDEYIPISVKPKFYFDTGTATLDSLYPVHQLKVDRLFLSKDYVGDLYKSLVFSGKDHTETSWRERLNIPMEFLLKKESGE